MKNEKLEQVIQFKNDYGKIKISEEVLAHIVGIAASESYGVVGMSSKGLSDGFAELLKRDSVNRGVKIESREGKLSIQVDIVVGYGMRLSEVASNVVNQVQYAVENLTVLTVGEVIVQIQGVKLAHENQG